MKIKPYHKNAKRHPQKQVEQIAASIQEFGMNQPIVVDKDGVIIVGHGRYAALQHLGWEMKPEWVVTVDLSPEQANAYRLADNKLNESDWDLDLVIDDLAALPLDLAELTGFDLIKLQKELAYADGENGALADKFGVPPFSVLDTKQGYWQERRNAWLKKTGNLTETKENVLGGEDNMLSTINGGSSNFDPVLAELMFKWFCKPNGHILDPFGGEQTKGVVAGELGFTYSAVEFRAEQVALNQTKTANYKKVKYIQGDSERITELLPGKYDMVFTSPPYYDLEVYSKEDMSALGTYDEFIAKYENIMHQCAAMLKPDSFYVVKIGEVRDPKTGVYRNFLGDNIRIGISAGLHYYNELVLVNSAGTAPLRAGKLFGSRKMVKLHQNILVFYKGDPKNIKNVYPADIDITAA